VTPVEVEVRVVDKLSFGPLLCIFARRFAEFDARPRVASPRDTITVTGKLEYHATALCGWFAAGGDEVELYVDGKKVSSQKTDREGRFQFTLRASDLGLGKHVVYAVAPEFWRGCYAKSTEVAVEVVTDDEKRSRETQSMLMWAGIAATTVVAVVGVGIALYQRERHRELLTIMASRK
jgi:hypothetical protein